MPLCERERIKNTGHTTLLFLFSKFPAPSSSEAQTKHFIPGSVAKTERVCHPHFRDACEQYHEHERGGKEGWGIEEESLWILPETTDVPPFFSTPKNSSSHDAVKIERVALIYRGGGDLPPLLRQRYR